MSHSEIEIKFLVPPHSRAGLVAALARAASPLQRQTLAAMYLDTPDRRLASAGIAWRLRREGRRWVQTLKAAGASALERFEHEVLRPGASADASVHAGTVVGERLIALLAQAQADGVEPVVRYRTEVRRSARRLRTAGAVVEVAFDEGRIVAGETTLRLREVEFELVSGSAVAMLALAERWRARFGLVLDPRTKSERGDGLADGAPHPPLRKAGAPAYVREATPVGAFGAVVDECLAQVTRNGIGLVDGDPALRADHVHQLRVGIRRLRSALRCFGGWVQPPPEPLLDGLRQLFDALGRVRDRDVLGSGVMAELAAAGAPPVAVVAEPPAPDPGALLRDGATQQLLLAWVTWRMALTAAAAAAADAAPLTERAERRLRRWHERIVADGRRFDSLDDEALHALRKRIKRQRYAVEFFAPLLRPKQAKRYLAVLATVQDRMGQLNDLFVARARYQALPMPDDHAWFARGWLAARIAGARALAGPELARLARVDPPTA